MLPIQNWSKPNWSDCLAGHPVVGVVDLTDNEDDDDDDHYEAIDDEDDDDDDDASDDDSR